MQFHFQLIMSYLNPCVQQEHWFKILRLLDCIFLSLYWNSFWVSKQSLLNQPVFPEDEQYTCSHCVKTYASQSTLHVHMAQVHSAAKPFQCDLCPRSYKYKKSLRIHKIKHQGMAQPHLFFILRLLYEFHLTMLFS